MFLPADGRGQRVLCTARGLGEAGPQELLAPKSVEFFDKNGTRLCDKSEAAEYIHRYTGIPIEALNGAKLSTFSIKERYSWSKNRVTTLPQDRFYRLLGVLGIYMDINYDEGKEKAKRRFMGQIREQQRQRWIQKQIPENLVDSDQDTESSQDDLEDGEEINNEEETETSQDNDCADIDEKNELGQDEAATPNAWQDVDLRQKLSDNSDNWSTAGEFFCGEPYG
jgi:hypothetical protein